MPRYIEVEDAVKVADFECGQFRGMFGRIKEQLEAMPTADVVEVVRCKDCLLHGVCRFELGLGAEGFCSQGERREDADN